MEVRREAKRSGPEAAPWLGFFFLRLFFSLFLRCAVGTMTTHCIANDTSMVPGVSCIASVSPPPRHAHLKICVSLTFLCLACFGHAAPLTHRRQPAAEKVASACMIARHTLLSMADAHTHGWTLVGEAHSRTDGGAGVKVRPSEQCRLTSADCRCTLTHRPHRMATTAGATSAEMWERQSRLRRVAQLNRWCDRERAARSDAA